MFQNGWTSLINAAYWCQPAAVKALIENGCNPQLTNDASRTALHELCRSNSAEELKLSEIADMLIEANCKIDAKCSDLGEADFTPLMFCAYHNHPKVAEKLIKAGCNINSQGSVSTISVGFNLYTRLEINAQCSDFGEADFMPLLLHAYCSHLKVGEKIIKAVCNINSQGS